MTNTEKKTLLILDGHSMAFRAFYALPAESFMTESGQYTNAVHGFTSMLLTMIKERQPTHVAVAFDLDTPTFRSQDYAEYKAGRAKTPEEFHGQIDLINQVMGTLNIPTITVDGYEADDILATMAAKGEAEGFHVLVVSGDRDTFQLITDKTEVLYPMKGVSEIPPMTAAEVERRYGVGPERYPDLAALVGEDADNLPGVPKVGPKTAAKWINQYGGTAQILEHADEIKGKVGENLREYRANVERNLKLNRLVRDLDLPIELESTRLEQLNRDAMEELFDALEFRTMRKKALDTFGELFGQSTVTEDEDAPQVPEARIVTEAAAAEEFLSQHSGKPLGVDFTLVTVKGTPGQPVEPNSLPVKTTSRSNNTPVTDDVTAVALCAQDDAIYIQLPDINAELHAVLADYLADPAEEKIVHDVKRIVKALHGAGLELAGVIDDTNISGYLIQPDRRGYDLAELASFYLKTELGEQSPAGQQAFDFGDGADDANQQLAQERVERAFTLLQLHHIFAAELIERGANQLLLGLEIPLALVLAEMEMTGIAVSTEGMNELLDHFNEQLEEITARAYAAAGREINLSSPKQLQELLFDELDLPKTRKIKTGYSTDAESLHELYNKTGNKFLEALMQHRDVTKLKQTVQGLAEALADDDRIHTTYSQVAAATGRLSSLRPNLQNIPVRSEEGRKIRNIFVVGEGYETLLTADYSQIEMRIMAHLSEDEGLIQAFKDGEDLHRFVGAQVFHVEPEDVSAEMRAKVKAMSYGLVYGLSSFGLSKQLGIGVDEARELMSGYFSRFGAVRDYLSNVVAEARKDGYTSTIEGRRRYLPDLGSSNRQRRDMAERAALNAPIQGSAADIIKRAMLELDQKLRAGNYSSRMLLQVHDELVLEIAPGELEEVTELVKTSMGSAATLSVPLDVHIGTGDTWHAAAH
ncbi:DNA polymerase I [Micrococcoides hystricis]|uniref:DNA polymerase I n=1 Tax=Micrococcoides hystricis TaxID=1572761 RepID=A0ABV6P717_9MICC